RVAELDRVGAVRDGGKRERGRAGEDGLFDPQVTGRIVRVRARQIFCQVAHAVAVKVQQRVRRAVGVQPQGGFDAVGNAVVIGVQQRRDVEGRVDGERLRG